MSDRPKTLGDAPTLPRAGGRMKRSICLVVCALALTARMRESVVAAIHLPRSSMQDSIMIASTPKRSVQVGMVDRAAASASGGDAGPTRLMSGRFGATGGPRLRRIGSETEPPNLATEKNTDCGVF